MVQGMLNGHGEIQRIEIDLGVPAYSLKALTINIFVGYLSGMVHLYITFQK